MVGVVDVYAADAIVVFLADNVAAPAVVVLDDNAAPLVEVVVVVVD